MTRVLLALLLGALACDDGPAPADASVDALRDTSADATSCGIPDGADPRVGAGRPAPGWTCTRLPFPLHAPRDVTLDGDEVLVTELSGGRIVRLAEDGFETIAEGLRGPIGLRVLDDATLVVGEEPAHSVARIDRASGTRTEIAGDLTNVTYITLHEGDVYASAFARVSEPGTGVVWRVRLDGTATHYQRDLGVPEGLLFDAAGALVVVEWQRPTRLLRFAEPGGAPETLTDDLTEAYGLASDGEGGYLVGDHTGRIVRVRTDGRTEVVLDDIARPGGIARADDGTVWIAEFVDFGATGYLIRLAPTGT